MKLTEMLAAWIMVQLLIVGFITGFIFNDWADCKTPEKAHSAWGVPLISTVLPLIAFIPELAPNPYCSIEIKK